MARVVLLGGPLDGAKYSMVEDGLRILRVASGPIENGSFWDGGNADMEVRYRYEEYEMTDRKIAGHRVYRYIYPKGTK